MLEFPHSPLLQSLQYNAAVVPDKTAIISGKAMVSYSELLDKILNATAYLSAAGIGRGDKIVLSANKDIEFVYLYFAAHAIGVVNVIVDMSSKSDRIEYVVGKTEPKSIFGISTDDIPGISYSDLRLTENKNANVVPYAGTDINDTADIMFTTGTTGNPKGVCLSHGNIASSANNINSFIGNGQDDVEVLGLPLSHSFGLGRLRCVLSKGGTLVLLGNFANIKLLFETIETHNVTGFGMVPAIWSYIRKFSGNRIAAYADRIRYIEIGSAAMIVEDKELLVRLFPNTRICMHYGLTEASRAFFSEFHEYRNNLTSIGKPSSAEISAIIADEFGREVPVDEYGEICIKGSIVVKSYLDKADNENAFFGDYFRTGDWGYKDKNECYYLAGRKKELINIGGEKINPTEIEDAIKSLGISDCACIGIPDPNGILGEVPKAFLLKTGSAIIDIDDIKLKLSSRLAPHFIPVEFEWIDRIPRTSSGKIQRLLLKR